MIVQQRTRAPEIASFGAASVREALTSGPKFFSDLMRETGSRDGRELALILAELSEKNELRRLPNGEYALSGPH
jgi:hypothetical protein